MAKFAESSEHGGGIGGGVGGGSASSILQSLITLGFLLVDCVKKDEPASKNVVEASALLGNTLDLSVLNRISCGPSEDGVGGDRFGIGGWYFGQCCCYFIQGFGGAGFQTEQTRRPMEMMVKVHIAIASGCVSALRS